MAKDAKETLATMTRVEFVARIVELQRAVDWRDAKLAEAEATIARLRELLDAERAKHSGSGTSGDSSHTSPSDR
jgi:hypothetical protein